MTPRPASSIKHRLWPPPGRPSTTAVWRASCARAAATPVSPLEDQMGGNQPVAWAISKQVGDAFEDGWRRWLEEPGWDDHPASQRFR